jgi:hypothetical protein
VGWCIALVAQAESPALLSEPVRLSELFRPQTFLNAVRQQTARHTGASMDSLKVRAAHLQYTFWVTLVAFEKPNSKYI